MPNPLCPRCGKPTKIIMYGLPIEHPSEEDDWVIGGCDTTFAMDEAYVCEDCEITLPALPEDYSSEEDM